MSFNSGMVFHENKPARLKKRISDLNASGEPELSPAEEIKRRQHERDLIAEEIAGKRAS